MINRERLVDEFMKLAAIESPSRHEGELTNYLKNKLKELNAEVSEDKTAEKTGGNSGNLIGRIPGNRPSAGAMILNAHMDTVSPGRGIVPVIRDGIIYSVGDTILGSDDKSGIAIILEVIRTVRGKGIPHGNLELVFTVCEEVGLLGAKNLDTSLLEADFGFALDSTQAGSLVHAAPAANHLKFKIYGREAHAGLSPETGISAIQLASKAISKMTLGRIDEETTANIGIIKGGTATNIIPGTVEMDGEARSHNMEKLKENTEKMVAAVRETVEKMENNLPELPSAAWDVEIHHDYPLMYIDEESRTIKLAKKAAQTLGRELPLLIGGGGSDANIFNNKGIEVAVLGTGMDKVHTNEEQIKIDDIVESATILMEIVRENGRA